MIHEFMTEHQCSKVVGTQVRFFVAWDENERFGTLTRVGATTAWVGAYCYSISQFIRLREWTV